MRKSLSFTLVLTLGAMSWAGAYAQTAIPVKAHAAKGCECYAANRARRVTPSSQTLLVAPTSHFSFFVHDVSAPVGLRAATKTSQVKKTLRSVSPSFVGVRKSTIATNMPIGRKSSASVKGSGSTGNVSGAAAVAAARAFPPPAPSILEPDTSMDSQVLHITVGHSKFFRVPGAELRNVYVSNPKVIGTFTPDPHHILINAKAPGVATFVAWNVDHVGHSYTVSSDVDVSQLVTALRSEFPREKINASSQGSKVVLTGDVATAADYKLATSIAKNYGTQVSNSLDIVPRHGKEVLLKVRFAEVDRSKLEQLGFNLLSQAQTIGLSTTGEYQSFTPSSLGGSSSTGAVRSSTQQIAVSDPLNLLLFSSTYNIGAALKALETHNVLQILAEPDLVAMSGKPATFLSGGKFPFPVVEGGTGNSVAVSIQFRPYGVSLNFTPTVLPDGTIRLHVAPKVSALDYTNEVQIDGYTIPALDTRQAETDVELRSGQSFVISGLIDHRLTDTFEKMPFLGDLPILGQFFKSKSVNASDVELMVIVTPTLINPLHAPVMKPALPKLAKPFLNTKKFDSELPGKAPYNSY